MFPKLNLHAKLSLASFRSHFSPDWNSAPPPRLCDFKQALNLPCEFHFHSFNRYNNDKSSSTRTDLFWYNFYKNIWKYYIGDTQSHERDDKQSINTCYSFCVFCTPFKRLWSFLSPLHISQNGYYKQQQEITSVGKDVGKVKALCTVGEWYKLVQLLWKTAWQFLKQLKIKLSCDSASLLWVYIPKNWKVEAWRDSYTPTFTALFATAKRSKQPEVHW